MAKQVYQPPRQGVVGQWIDVIVLLVLIFVALYAPVKLNIAVPARVEKLPPGVSYEMKTTTDADGNETQAKQWTGLTWEALGQNPTMQQQWEKLGYTVESAADIITQPFDYTLDWLGVIGMIVLIGGYYVFMLWHSEKEYRQVIAEKFD